MRLRLRPIVILAFVLLLASGCAQPATDPGPQGRPLQRGGSAIEKPSFAPLTLDDYVYAAPNATGSWGAAFWIRAEATRSCDFWLRGTGKSQGGTWDSIGVVARGWNRPEMVGRFDHGFHRGDGYVAHAGTTGLNHSAKPGSVTAPVVSFEHRRKVDLPQEALIIVGNTYMAPPEAGGVGLRLSLACDGPFVLLHAAESPRLLAYGPEDFDGVALVDTIVGLGAQRQATKTLSAESGFVLLLHEDGNQGNAQYRTTRPDGGQQVDTFGNRIVVGPEGTWRVDLDRVSPSPQGEFRLFALDVAPPAL